MKLKTTVTLLALAALSCCWATPIVSNVKMEQIEGTKDVRITYDLADNFNTQLWVSVSAASINSGSSYLPMNSVEGDVRRWVAPGVGKEIIWHAGIDWNGHYITTAKATINTIAKVRDEFCICTEGNLKFKRSGGSWFANAVERFAYSSPSNPNGYDIELETMVYGAGTLAFNYKVNSSSDYHSFYLVVDGKDVKSLKTTNWNSYSYRFTTSGPHKVVWRHKGTQSTSLSAYISDVTWK